MLPPRADELEALRLSLGDLRSPTERAGGRPPVGLLLAKITLAAGNYHTGGLCLL